MSEAGWDSFHRRWQALRPPLRPDASVVAAIGRVVAGQDDRLLLLGATPELSVLGRSLVAIDWSETAIARIWPGDDARRRIVRADWRRMPFASGTFDAAIGDGSLNVLPWPDVGIVLAAVARALRPGALLAVRCYLSPAVPESLEDIAADLERLPREGFHALKWRIAMAVAADIGPGVPVAAILTAFERMFPDRGELAAATGWALAAIAEIDAYRGSATHLSFPTADALLARIGPDYREARLVPAGTYPLAERCPILVAVRS